MGASWLQGVSEYVQGGAMHAAGGMPVGKVAGGGTLYELMGTRFEVSSAKQFSKGAIFRSGLAGATAAGVATAIAGGDMSDVGTAAATGGFVGGMWGNRMKLNSAGAHLGAVGQRTWASTAMHLLPTAGLSGYFVYQGYKENGLKGARDAAVWDVATNAAVAKFGYNTIHAEAGIGATAGAVMSKGLLSHGARFLGAGIGAQVGQAIGDQIGLPGASIAGAFAGAFVGAAPIRFMASHPILAAGAVVAGGLAATGYGAYEVMKMGYAQKASRRGIQTAGDLAAFNTSGANTMRQRSVMAIQKSQTNARSALGQEGNFMHYPSKNYHSQYRM